MLNMAEKTSFGFTVIFSIILTACFLLVSSAEPKLHISPPNQNPIVAPAKVSFGLLCEGKAEDGEFTDMKWFNPDGEEIRGNVRKTGSMLKLTFDNPSVEDSGNYKCTALFSNTLTLEAEVRVDFYEPIKFEECPEIQNLVVGQEGRIKCQAVANPRPTIVWEKDNNPINSDRITIDEFGLTIPSVSKEDGGTYSIEALVKETGSNRVQKIEVNVLTRPSALTQMVFDKVTATTITFRLMGPGNTGGMPITHYNMKYRLAEQKDDPVKEVTWEKDTPYILSNLVPRAMYEFSAAAINVVGVGDYIKTVYRMPEETVPEPPLIKTKQETISEYPDRFEVRWDIPNNNGKPILKYIIRYFKVERGLKEWTQTEKSVERAIDAEYLSYMLTGLMPDAYYKIEIRATNEIGNSLPESVVIKTSKGNTTTSFRNALVVNVTARSVKFAFEVTGKAKYVEVLYGTRKNVTEFSAKCDSDDACEIQDLIPAERYIFKFRTIPSNNSQWSRTYEVVLLPDVPEVIFEKIDSGTIKLQWLVKYEVISRKTIDKYEITYFTVQRQGVDDRWVPSGCRITIQIPECSSNSYTLAGLTQKSYYEIQVRAHTVSGYGEPYRQKISNWGLIP